MKIVGIHEHRGSGWLEVEEPLLSIDIMLDIANKFPDLEFIDFGGGFGVPHKPDQGSLDLKSLGIEFSKKIDDFKRSYCRNFVCRFEPGRYLVAEAGDLLAEVTILKKSPEGLVFAGTDSGMNQLVRVAMYDSYHPITNIGNPDGDEEIYDICGNVCESADFFGKRRGFAKIREGDILSIGIAGAYGMSMASNYQFRSLPAEVLVDGSIVHLINPRQTFSDLIDRYGFNIP